MSEILPIFFRLPKSASAGQWGLGHLTGYRGKKWPFWARRCEIWPKNHFPWKLELIFCPKKVFGGTPNTLWWWCQFPRVNIDQPHQQIKTKVWAKPKPFNFRDLASSLIDWVGNILILILGIDHWWWFAVPFISFTELVSLRRRPRPPAEREGERRGQLTSNISFSPQAESLKWQLTRQRLYNCLQPKCSW